MLLNSFLLSVNAIVSIFVMMAVGYGAKRLLTLEKSHVQKFNALVFHTLLPLMLFYNIYTSDIRGGVSFRCLGLALECAEQGGTSTAVLNGANEAAVALFLEDRISFLDIPRLVERALERIPSQKAPGLDAILDADRAARQAVYESVR